MKTFYRFHNGTLETEQTADDKALPREGWSETTDHQLTKHYGKQENWFDIEADDIKIIEEKERIRRGIQKDNRGRYFNIETREEKIIKELDETIDETLFTKEIPLENEMYQKFNNEKWVIDTEKKEIAEKERTLALLKAEVSEAERKIIRPMRAIQQNRATDADREKFNELDTICENKRPQITALELELKTA